jgi:hypothetical protein
MALIILNLSANFAAILLNGFVGEIPTFVNHATNGKMRVTMFQEKNEANFQNVQVQNSVLLKYNIQKTEKNTL